MTFGRWLSVIGLVVAIGMMKVAQETALALDAYRTGRAYTKLHDVETDTLWLETKVVALQSPIALASTMKERHVQLVAWSRLTTPLAVVQPRRPSAGSKAQLAKEPQAD